MNNLTGLHFQNKYGIYVLCLQMTIRTVPEDNTCTKYKLMGLINFIRRRLL